MNTITAAIENIATSLQADLALQSFSSTSWGKSITAETGFRQRSEIHLSDLPLVRVVRPQVEEDPYGLIQSNIRLYIGFLQNDHEQALADAVQFGEQIRRVLRLDRRRGGNTQTTILGPMVNDEGFGHPVYFSIMSVSTPLYGGQATLEEASGLMDALGDFLMGADETILQGADS